MLVNEQDFISFVTVKRGLEETSIRHCAIRIRVINKWFVDKELTKVTVEKFFYELKEKGLKNNSLNTYRFVFIQLVAYCKDRGLPSEFFDGFKSFKKTKAEIIIFTPEEIQRILTTHLTYGKFRGIDTQFLDFRYLTLTMFLAYTGCRYSEAANLKVKRLDLSAGEASFVDTKNDENRTVYLFEPLISNLKELVKDKNPEDNVFCNAMGKQVHVTDFSEDLKRRAVAAGVTKRTFPHNFRHSYITHMLEAGVQAELIATLTGHKDIQVIYDTYMHLADKTKKRTAMRHPLVRLHVDPHEILRSVKETVENLHLDNHPYLDFKVKEENGIYGFELSVKNSKASISEFFP